MQRFGRQHVNESKTSLRYARNQLHTRPLLIRVIRSRKMLVDVRSELLRQFINTLTSDNKYSRQNLEKFSQQVPMPTSLKLKNCSRFFIAFLKSTLNFEYFERKDQSKSLSITEIINCETGSYLNVQKAIFHSTLPKITC